jgi:hypothetical protein
MDYNVEVGLRGFINASRSGCISSAAHWFDSLTKFPAFRVGLQPKLREIKLFGQWVQGW